MSGYRGVKITAAGNFEARIHHEGEKKGLGSE